MMRCEERDYDQSLGYYTVSVWNNAGKRRKTSRGSWSYGQEWNPGPLNTNQEN